MKTIADSLKESVDMLRWKNQFKEGELTPFLQPIEDWHVPLIITQLKAESDYDARVQQVEEFNRTHKWKKRGITLIPTKFGLSFATALHLNQAGALVHIYHDGSLLLAHGGISAWQSANGSWTVQKNVPDSSVRAKFPLRHNIHLRDFFNTVANTSSTAASAGSDLNGMAIQHACQQLNPCLEPYRQKYGPDATLKTFAHAAYLDRVNLSAKRLLQNADNGLQMG